ncbi:hypothetical protein [Nostoc sp.]|uniref:hypothetical protein n=1 Tax=Nostoc sp. TaxID=1180 RepID=UPI002FFBB966
MILPQIESPQMNSQPLNFTHFNSVDGDGGDGGDGGDEGDGGDGGLMTNPVT